MALIDDILTTFRAEIPELASTSDADVRREIGTALEVFAARKRGTAYLAAHLLATRDESTDGGSSSASSDGGTRVIQHERIGDKSISYFRQSASSASGGEEHWLSDTFLETTYYGRVYLMIRDAATMPTIRNI